jgi:hypothetical protein
MPTLAKGTLKIAEKYRVATAIFQHGQGKNESLGFFKQKVQSRCPFSDVR